MAYYWPQHPMKRVEIVGQALNSYKKADRKDRITAAKLAKRYRVSADMINSLNLVYHAHDEVLRALDSGLISQSQAVELARVKPNDEQLPYLNICLLRRTSVRELRQTIKSNNKTISPMLADKNISDPDTKMFISRIEEKLASPVKILFDSAKTNSYVFQVGYSGHIQMLEHMQFLGVVDSTYHVDSLHVGFDNSINKPYGILRISFRDKSEYYQWAENIKLMRDIEDYKATGSS